MRGARSGLAWMALAALLGVAGGAAGEKPWRGMQPLQVLRPIPAGLTLPVYLLHGIKAGSAKVGAEVEAVTTEAVPLSTASYLPQGARLVGRVVESRAGDKRAGVPAMLGIEFQTLRYRGMSVPVRTRVLAVANAADVSETFASSNDGSDRGNASPANWTTRQIGGDEVYREGWEGPVENGRMQKVGFADFRGVYANAPAGATGASALPRAVGVFSVDARGLYGFERSAALTSAGGVARLTSRGSLVVRGGDALLLEVMAAGQRP